MLSIGTSFAHSGGGAIVSFSHLVDVSPFSALGALCIANAAASEDRKSLFNKLMIWGLSMSVVGAVVCWVFFGLLGTAQVEEYSMKLRLLERSRTIEKGVLDSRENCGYNVSGLPPGEQAIIAYLNRAWLFLRWNDEWHGNWTGRYTTPDAALEGLREELLAVAQTWETIQ